MFARDSVVVSERLEVVLPSEGLLELLVIEPRRLDVRGGGIVERSGSETSRLLSAKRCKSGLPSCANAFCTAAGDSVEETVVVVVEAGPVPLAPRLGLGLLPFLIREIGRSRVVWWELLTTREVRRTGEGSRDELVELFPEADADRLPGVGKRGTKDTADPLRRGCWYWYFVSLSRAGLLRPVPDDGLARDVDLWAGLFAGVEDSLDGMMGRRGEGKDTERERECDHPVESGCSQ